MIMLLNLSGLVLTILFVAGVYTGAVKVAEKIAGESFSGVFVFSLVPIAFVYALAHYFSLLVVQGQFAIPLLIGSVRSRLGSPRDGRLPAEARRPQPERDLVRRGRRARPRPCLRPHRRP